MCHGIWIITVVGNFFKRPWETIGACEYKGNCKPNLSLEIQSPVTGEWIYVCISGMCTTNDCWKAVRSYLAFMLHSLETSFLCHGA